jgi:predicted transcriptional regulator
MTLELTENSSKRRDRLVIMAEIVGIAKKGSSKTHIMFKANLSFSQLNQYLSLLSKTGLLEETAINGRVIFKATPKGLEFMERQHQVIDMLNEDTNSYRNCIKTSPLVFTTFQTSKPFTGIIHRVPQF